MKERDTRNQKVIEEFVLVNNEKHTTYIEKNATVEPISIGKQGPIFRVVTEDGIVMGIVGDNKKIKRTDEYKDHLMKKLGPYYKMLALDSNDIEADVMEMIRKQQEHEKEKAQEIERQRQNVQKIEEEKAREQNKTSSNKEYENVINQNQQNSKDIKDNKGLVLTRKELQQHQFALIKDREFARRLVTNLDELDYFSVCVVMIDGKPKVMAQRKDNAQGNNKDEFVEITPYMGAKTEMGTIDSIENGEEKEDIKKGDVITFKDRNGETVKIDARITNGGSIEVRDVTEDRDGDGDKEGTLIETRTYTPAIPSASKIANQDELTNEKKEDDGFDYEEWKSERNRR